MGAAAVGIVVLGASNVSRGLARLVALSEAGVAPADILIAAGHGRSYGANSRVWARRLPSILRCGLWRRLDREGWQDGGRSQDARPLHALVTDVGNDLLYGFSVDEVAAWVRACVVRLAERNARIAMTRLPLASIASVGGLRYRGMRTLFVPGCRLSLAEIKAAAVRLDASLVEIAAHHGATLIDQPAGWYGIDAIHVRRRYLSRLWERAFTAWGLEVGRQPRRSLARWAAVGSKAAEVRSLAGAMRFTPQPVLHLRSGGTLSFY